MIRRGFTLLETVLAAAVGAVLVLMVVGVMAFINRAEGAQAARLEQLDGMSRLQKIMSRAFSTLVVADPNSGSAFRSKVLAEGLPSAAEEVPPRMLLGEDESPTLSSAFRRGGVAGDGAVQRLEVVLDHSPVPRGLARGMGGTLGMSVQANLDESDAPAIKGLVRGVFELRPDRATYTGGAPMARREDGRIGWTLWWRALPDEDSLNRDPTEDAEAVPIISGLSQCVWRAFVKRKRQGEIRVVTNLELPAYMEMEVRTLGGQYANWMFEVQWTVGAGPGEEPLEPAAAPEGGRFKATEVKPEGAGAGGGAR